MCVLCDVKKHTTTVCGEFTQIIVLNILTHTIVGTKLFVQHNPYLPGALLCLLDKPQSSQRSPKIHQKIAGPSDQINPKTITAEHTTPHHICQFRLHK